MTFKKIAAILTATAAAFSITLTANAKSVDNQSVYVSEMERFLNSEESDGFALVSEESVDEGDGITSTTYLYMQDDGISTCSNSGTKTYLIYKLYEKSSSGQKQNWVLMWNKSTFSWNKETDYVDVNVLDSRYEKLYTSAVVKTPYSIKWGVDGTTFLFGKKYAYVSQTVELSNSTSGWSDHTFELWIDVDVTGAAHPRTGNSFDPPEFGEV